MDITTPNAAALEITELLLPYIGMVMIVIFGFMIKDFATKMSKGIAFSMNKQFQEGDHVLIDGERALIVKIGFTQTVFGVTKSNGEFDGDYVWRYVPNERIDYLKLEKIVDEDLHVDTKQEKAQKIIDALQDEEIKKNGREIKQMKGSNR